MRYGLLRFIGVNIKILVNIRFIIFGIAFYFIHLSVLQLLGLLWLERIFLQFSQCGPRYWHKYRSQIICLKIFINICVNHSKNELKLREFVSCIMRTANSVRCVLCRLLCQKWLKFAPLPREYAANCSLIIIKLTFFKYFII